MNLTVGPLPPAVYWRRRAVVLGVLLLVVVLFVAMCSGSGESKTGATGPSSPSPTATSTVLSPVIDGQSPSSSASSASSSPSSAPPVVATTDAGPPPTPCLDTEMSLTVIVHVRKDDVELQMKVKNISNRACTRDVGGTPQEIHVTTGTAQPTDPVVWSSDYCQGTNPPPDVRTFNPGIESILPATPVLWSRKYVTAGCKAGNAAPVGTYAAGAKLGTLVSPAVQFTIT
jgi:hypothetical protein